MALLSHLPSILPSQHYKLLLWLCSMLIMSIQEENVTRSQQHRTCRQQQQHSLFSQASWGRLEMKPERNKFKVQAHVDTQEKKSGIECISNTGYWNNLDINQNIQNHTTSFHFFIVS